VRRYNGMGNHREKGNQGINKDSMDEFHLKGEHIKLEIMEERRYHHQED